ncbi:uncharacterized protein LOC141613801 [Silene latifolia]|uniref:uncharacterized protein LOC141613801 n=1 Tax=Silene latifolia TaxID=37657 RepID=UPI003D76EB0F
MRYCKHDLFAMRTTLSPVTKEEIKGVVFSIPIDKAPGPDGYTSGFFRDSWDIVGDEVCSAIMDFFANGCLLTQINATNITLIPKCDRQTAVSHFRPIACCSLVYKVISKLLCNRLASVLPDIILENQGAFIKGRWPFQYHPLCKNLKLTHLMFADDLLLFCKGKPQSIWLLMRAFSSFSKASGLAMNNAKSEIFFNGVSEDITEGIKHVTGFTEGTMPFRYLGVPIKAGRLTKQECSALTEKMVNYWAQMFIIPKSIINHIMAICRNFLWDGSPEYHRVPLVAWDKVTLPKKEGGLGIKKVDVWNVATVGKLVNWIYCKADRLWIKWINDVYIKNRDWHSYSPHTDATCVWKNICKVKEKLKDGYTDSIWTLSSKSYSIKGGYDWLAPAHITLNWTAIV